MRDIHFLVPFIGSALVAVALAAWAFRVEAVRNWRIRLCMRASHQAEEVVRGWYKGSYNGFTDSLLRLTLLCGAVMAVLVGVLLFRPLTGTEANDRLATICHYGLGVTVDILIFTLALKYGFAAETAFEEEVISRLPYKNYDYAKADLSARRWMRKGVVASIGARVFALVAFCIGCWIASAIYGNLCALWAR